MTNGNGVVTTYAYRPDNRRLLKVQATLPVGYTFNNFNFTYDKVGNVTQLQNTAQPPGSFTAGGLGNAIGGPETKTFAYDDLYRLTSSTGCHDITATGCLSTPPTGMFTYSFSQSYDSIHNITHKTQTAMQNSAVNPQITYDNAYIYPAPGSAHPHSPTAIGEFNLTTDPNGNQITTQDTKTSDVNQYLFDEENRLSCTNKGPQMPSPSCVGSNLIDFIYDHAGVRKIKSAATPTIYPNQYYTDFGGGSGSQFKHIFIGAERILTKKTRIAPDREHWYYHPDHLGSTTMVTNELSQLVDHLLYFPFGEVWLEERPSSLPEEFFFAAKEFDPETGFYDFGARYLDPRFSKWMSTDPALASYLPAAASPNPSLPGLGGTFQPANLALYGYSHNNPATLLDRTGLEPESADKPGFFRSTWNSIVNWWTTPIEEGNHFHEMVPGSCPVCTAHPEFATSYDYMQAEYIDRPWQKGDIAGAALEAASLIPVGRIARTGGTVLSEITTAERAGARLALPAPAKPAGLLPAPRPANVPWAAGIQFYKEGNMTVAEHIFWRHGPSSTGWFKPTSRFAEGTSLRNVRELVNEAAAKGTRIGNGITYDFGRTIGYDLQGNPTTRLQVYLNQAGEVRTAYPY